MISLCILDRPLNHAFGRNSTRNAIVIVNTTFLTKVIGRARIYFYILPINLDGWGTKKPILLYQFFRIDIDPYYRCFDFLFF